LQATYFLEEERIFGARVADYAAGSLHSHLIGYKVDLDVLGTANTFVVTDFPMKTFNFPWFDSPKLRYTTRVSYSEREPK
jgi:hypothetical protein